MTAQSTVSATGFTWILARVPTTLRVAGAALLALLIGSAWLVFPYYMEGDALLSNAGDNTRQLKGSQVSRFYSRTLLDHPVLELAATFATEDFFQYVDDAAVIRNLRPDRNFIFYVNETVHAGSLPDTLPRAQLLLGDTAYPAQVATGPVSADHHRVTVVSFTKTDAQGVPIVLDDYPNIRLSVSNAWLGGERPRTFLAMWEAPYVLPDSVSEDSNISLIIMLALGAGLLSSVLTPCLLQMMVIFGGITTGFATLPGTPSGASTHALVRRKMRFTALAFALGFILLYVAAGALIGLLGFNAQLIFAEYRPQLSFAAGALVLLLGLWVPLRGHRAVVCRIPPDQLSEITTRRDAIASSLTAIGTALGCTVCFGGAIVGTLIIYVGVIGDALTGAGIMLVFALGFAAPLLLAAWSLSLSESFLGFISTHTRSINLVSSALIVTFGIILMTDNFHVVSDFIYPYLGLG